MEVTLPVGKTGSLPIFGKPGNPNIKNLETVTMSIIYIIATNLEIELVFYIDTYKLEMKTTDMPNAH